MQSLISHRSPHFLVDTSSFFTSPETLLQLHSHTTFYGLSSPLWVTSALAAARGLTPAHLSPPLPLWAPGCGETFFPVTPSAVARGPHPLTGTAAAAAAVALLSVTAHESHAPVWVACPDTLRRHFDPRVSRVWVSALLAGDTAYTTAAAAAAGYTVCAAPFAAVLFNADQFVECAALDALRNAGYAAMSTASAGHHT